MEISYLNGEDSNKKSVSARIVSLQESGFEVIILHLDSMELLDVYLINRPDKRQVAYFIHADDMESTVPTVTRLNQITTDDDRIFVVLP